MRSNTTSSHAKLKWIVYAVLGLLLIGAGLSMAIDAGFSRYTGESWIGYGTAALVVFNSGICLVVDAGLWKMRSLDFS